MNDYFQNIDYQPSIELLVNVISNSENISKILEFLLSTAVKVSDEQDNEEYLKLSSITLNDEIVNILECYCVMKGINVYEESYNLESLNKDYSEIYDTSLETNEVSAYIHSLTKPILSKEEEKDLLERINNSEGEEKIKYKKEFIEHNLRLVVSIASKYSGYNNHLLLDLI